MHRSLERKTFRERARYLTIAVHFFPWWLFLAVWSHALLQVARRVVDAGGTGAGDVGLLSLGSFLEAASWGMVTLTIGQLIHSVVGLVWAPPSSELRLTRLLYCGVWTAAICFLAFFPGTFGGGIWWVVVCLKLLAVALGNGALHPIARCSFIASNIESVRLGGMWWWCDGGLSCRPLSHPPERRPWLHWRRV